MSDVPAPEGPFAARIHFMEKWAKERDEELRRSLSSPTGLPVRPNLHFYRNRVAVLHRQARVADAGAKLSASFLALARENGFPSWPKFRRAIRQRNERAARLEDALRLGQEAEVAAIVGQDRDALLDVGATCSRAVLAHLLKFGQLSQKCLDDLLNAVLKYHDPGTLWECAELLVQAHANLNFAGIILHGRLDKLPKTPASGPDRESLEWALGQIASYEVYDNDLEYLPDDD